jgi:Zn-dependent protease
VLLAEPPPSPYDLRFHLLGIPVRVHPMFWFVALLLGLGGRPKPDEMLLWIGVVFGSILVHEMGHALMARAHGWPPSITLHGFGGLASYRPTYHTTRSSLLIAVAGPAAGFLFAAVVLATLVALGHRVELDWPPVSRMPFLWEAFTSRRANLLVFFLLYVNIFWGLVNLLPVYPLDGGQMAREVLCAFDRQDGTRQSLWLSLFVAAGIAILAFARLHDNYIAFFFAYLAYTSYSALQAYRGPGGGLGGYR